MMKRSPNYGMALFFAPELLIMCGILKRMSIIRGSVHYCL
jgi:hypothetical protein